MKLCPYKFSHYEFEGGQDCIGTECGMHKRCNADYEITAVEFDALDEHAQALERENEELRVKCDEHDEAERDWERKFNEAMGKEYSMRKELIAELDELRAGEWAKADNAIRELSEENDELRVERDALVDALGATDAIEWSQEQLENANPALVNANDSREKLEADVSKYVYDAWAQGWEAGQHDDMDCCNFYVSDMRALLDRQAAITERELCKQCSWPSLAAMPDKEAYDRIAELQAKVDELTELFHEKSEQLTDSTIRRNELERQGYELTAELTAARNAHAQAEHEAVILREKLGRMLDNAHEIARIGGDC